MSNAQEHFYGAIAKKLRADTGAGSLVELTGHSAANAASFRIARDKPVKVADTPFLGILVFTSVPQIPDGPTHVQIARLHFKCYSRDKELTAIKIADRMEHLLHARDEQVTDGTNVGYFDFSDDALSISNRQTRWRNRDGPDHDDDEDVWMVLVEADVIWVDETCG